MNKIMFSGHRNQIAQESVLNELAILHGENCLWIHGGAVGFDQQIETVAQLNQIPTQVFLPDYKKFGRSAPIVRNKQMLDEASLVVALYDGRKTGGTAMVVANAKKRGISLVLLPL